MVIQLLQDPSLRNAVRSGLRAIKIQAPILSVEYDTDTRCITLIQAPGGNEIKLLRFPSVVFLTAFAARLHMQEQILVESNTVKAHLMPKLWDVFPIEASAPGTGTFWYLVTRVDEDRAWGICVENDVRELSIEEVI